MLDQVIYTRCMPRRELTRKGEITRQDGFGVFSVSPAVVDGTRKIDHYHLQRRLATTNAAQEDGSVGLIHSYEYLELSETDYTLIFEFARPHCQIPRKNGQAHRKGTYIKQSLVGQFRNYPSDYFGASCWDAHKKSENDYYLDDSPNAEPEWLPQVSDVPQGGGISMEQIRSFVRDGRSTALKTALWFLLQEYAKPVPERRVLLIKDIPTNVELWVAAIEHAFSAPLARQITFSTNKSKLANQTDTALFYYTDAGGRYYAIRNTQVPMTRKPYCMIVGYHPMDKLSEKLRQLPTSNFVILDGTTKTLNVETDQRIHAPYFQAAVQYNEDLSDFCSIALPSLPLKQISPDIPELFDAFKYLLDSNHKSDKWSYQDTLAHFNQLTRYGLPTNETVNEYLLNQCISAYTRFSAQDADARYPLLQIMWKLALLLQRENEVRSSAVQPLTDGLQDLQLNGAQLQDAWRSLGQGNLMDMIQPPLLALFADEKLSGYALQFRTCDASVIRTVLDMYLSVVPNALNGIASHGTRFHFLTCAIAGMIDNRQETAALLGKFSSNPGLFSTLVIAVSKQLDSAMPHKAPLWWEIVMGVSGGSAAELCRRLSSHGNTDIDLVEKLLTDSILSSNRCSRETEQAFAEATRKLRPHPHTGRNFFFSWIQVADVAEVPRIIQAARNMNLTANTVMEVFQKLDNSLPYDIIKPAYISCVSAMEDWAASLHTTSRKIALARLRRNLEHRSLPVEQALQHVSDFAKKKFPVGDGFFQSDLFADLVFSVNEYEDPQLTLLMLSLFKFSQMQRQHYTNAYVEHSLNDLRGNTLIERMLFLTYLAIAPPQMLGIRSNKRIEAQIYLENALNALLPRYAKPHMDERIYMVENCPEQVRKALIKMLRLDDLNNPFGSIFDFFRR